MAEEFNAGNEQYADENKTITAEDAQTNEPAEIEPETEQPKTEEPVQYDADAVQHQTFNVDEDGEIYPSTYSTEPLGDERYFEFEEDCATKIVDDGENAQAERFEETFKLGLELIKDVTGFEGEQPADWKASLDPVDEVVPVVNHLLAAVVVEAEKPAKKGRTWVKPENSYTLESFFHGKPVETKHFLRRKNVEDGKAWEELQKLPLGKKKGLSASDELKFKSQARGKAELYDQMQTKAATGYKSRVPAWHKVAVIDHIFRSKLTQKK